MFGLLKQSLAGHGAVRKFNYTFLYMMYYIYSNKLKECSIILSKFVNKIILYSPSLINHSVLVHVSM